MFITHTHLVRACEKSLTTTPNFSWGFFNFGLRRSARPLPRCYSFPLASRGKRDIKTKRDLLLRRRLTLKIPQLKLGVCAPERRDGQRGESPLRANALRPEAKSNCVAARRGGEQQEAND
jgi:hypothetical protein